MSKPHLKTTTMLWTLLLTTTLIRRASTHQSISFPRPMTRDVACRISSVSSCGGPCPLRWKREDQVPNNPSVRVRRGQYARFNVLRNNHAGGFSRYSIVNIKDMHNKKAHRRNAFNFGCSDVRRTKCNARYKKRDCQFDKTNFYYIHWVKIPTCIPDGVYVLGWAWYGGGERWGLFGDYYDCLFIRIKGGPFTRKYKPRFVPGPTSTGKNGRCRATVNRLGVCWKEPCPGGGRHTKLMVPHEFQNNRQPAPLWRKYFRPYRPKRKTKTSPFVKSMTIRNYKHPWRIYKKITSKNRFPHLRLTKVMPVTITCETVGKVKYAQFFFYGLPGRTDTTRPFSIGGDWFDRKAKKTRLSPWQFPYEKRVLSITCKVRGFDNTEHYLSMELSTNF